MKSQIPPSKEVKNSKREITRARVIQAVIDEIFARFSASLDHTLFTGNDLSTRVQKMIAVIWSIFSQREYRVSVAILRNAGLSKESSIDGKRQLGNWAQQTSRLWDEVFTDHAGDRANSDPCRRLLFAALRGLADDINPAVSERVSNRKPELEALGVAITHLLSKGANT